MLKKFVVLIFVVIVLLLSIYSSKVSFALTKNMVISPVKISSETQELIEMFDDDVLIFDYKLDDTVKSFSFNLWAYDQEINEWRIAFKIFNNIRFLKSELITGIGEKNSILCTRTNKLRDSAIVDLSEFNLAKLNMFRYKKLSEPIKIKLNEEIVLIEKVNIEKNKLISNENKNFKDLDCNAGVAITIVFYDELIDELSD